MKNEKNPFVSVVLPVFNSEKYLCEAVDSILNQTYKNFELIAVYDASTDRSLEILSGYQQKDNRIKIINGKGTGLASALNEGIDASKGKYIARMDSDDISHPQRFEKQVAYLEKNTDVYLLGTNYSLIYEENVSEEAKKAAQGTHKRSTLAIDKEDWFLSTNETMKFIHPTIMVRRELFDLVGGYRDYKLEDLELYFRAGVNGLRIDKLDDVLLDYRVCDTSKSKCEPRYEARKEQTKELMEVKVHYLADNVLKPDQKLKYLIWGADISGECGVEIINARFFQSQCIAYIDSFREGEVNGYPVIKPCEIEKFNVDYIFICTNGGAVYARQYLKDMGMKEVRDFFKIS